MIDRNQEPDSDPTWGGQFRPRGDEDETQDTEGQPRAPIRGSLFASKSFAGGRVQVYGCSPGFLLLSLVVSVVLTILLNVLF